MAFRPFCSNLQLGHDCLLVALSIHLASGRCPSCWPADVYRLRPVGLMDKHNAVGCGAAPAASPSPAAACSPAAAAVLRRRGPSLGGCDGFHLGRAERNLEKAATGESHRRRRRRCSRGLLGGGRRRRSLRAEHQIAGGNFSALSTDQRGRGRRRDDGVPSPSTTATAAAAQADDDAGHRGQRRSGCRPRGCRGGRSVL